MTNDNFREALRTYLTDERGKPQAKNIKELRNLMRIKEFNMARDKAGRTEPRYPSNKQVAYAWRFLKQYAQVPLDDFLHKETIEYKRGPSERYRDPITGRFDYPGSRSKHKKKPID